MVKRKRASRRDSSEHLTQRIKELEENWKRALADYHNLEKRVSEQQKTFVRIANASLIDKLLGVMDDLERASDHLQDHGLKLVLSQFKSVLETEGVKEIEVGRKEFDPQMMDCVEIVKGPKNQVVKVLLKGYALNDQVIRPAKVLVGSGTTNADPEPSRRV